MDGGPAPTTLDCSGIGVDIVFAIDQSGSIGAPNFEKVKAYLTKRINMMTFDSASGPRMAVLGFSTSNRWYCRLQFDSASLLSCVAGMPFTGGWTNTPEAIREAGAELTRAGCDPTANRFCVVEVVTDGEPNLGTSSALSKADLEARSLQYGAELKAKKFIINSVGVGGGTGLTDYFLGTLASEPTDSHWARLDDFSRLDVFAEAAGRTCGVDATPSAGGCCKVQLKKDCTTLPQKKLCAPTILF